MAKTKEPEITSTEEQHARTASPDVTPEEVEASRQAADQKNTMLGDDRTTADYTSEEK